MDKLKEISEKFITTTHRVRFSDADPAGIVYFSNIPMFFDEGFLEIAIDRGFDFLSRDTEFMFPIVEQKVTYKSPLRAGQTYHVVTVVLHIGNRSLKSGHLIYHGDQENPVLVAFGYIARAIIDPKSFTAIPMPDSLSEALQDFLIEEHMWTQMIASFN